MRNGIFPKLLILLIITLPFIFAAGSGGGGNSQIVFSSFREEHTKELPAKIEYKLKLRNNFDLVFYIDEIKEDSIIYTMYEGTSFRSGNNLVDYTEEEMKVGETYYFDVNGNGKIDILIDLISKTKSNVKLLIRDLRDVDNLDKFVEEKITEIVYPCEHLVDLKARIRCRLHTEYEEDGSTLDNDFYFLPEECRSFLGVERKSCVKTYIDAQPCWKFERDDSRVDCVRKAVGIKVSIANEKALCKQAGENGICLEDLRQKVYKVIKFRIYNLEERAEEYLEDGVSEDVVAELIINLENKKIEFNEAESKLERKEIILSVKELWINFMREVNNE